MDTKDYLVTRHAGPKVAGQVVKRGAKIALTETQARAELLAGAIVPAPADGKSVEDPLKGSDTLDALRARALGLDGPAGDEEAEEPAPAKPARGKADTPPATPAAG